MIGIGVIGCGSISIYRHIPEYHSRKDCRLIGYFDPIPERAEKVVAQYGGKAYKTIEEMLKDEEIEAVSVCTSNKYHAPVSIAAMEAGKHVLCEKPMAISSQEAQRMIDTAKKTGRFLMIGHNQRLADAHIRAKELIKTGELGRILTFRTTFGHGGPENWSQDKGKHTWFFKSDDAFIGAMGDLGVHKADLIRWLIDDEIVEAKAYVAALDKTNDKNEIIEVDDNAICLLKSKTGIYGTLTASWTYYGAEDNSTVLYCTNGVMKIYDNPDFPIEITKKNREKIYYKVGKIQTNEDQSKSGVIDMFVDAIMAGIEPEINGFEGFEALKIVLACLESAKTGVTVKV